MEDYLPDTIRRINPNRMPSITLEGITTLANRDWMKFIQIQDQETDRMYLRAGPRSDYHRDILRKFENEALNTLRPGIHPWEWRFSCLGGGRIRRDYIQQEVEIYDYSDEFGKYDIAIVKSIARPYIRRKLPGWAVIFY